MKDMHYSTKLALGASILVLASYNLYQHYKLKKCEQRIDGLTLDYKAAQIFLYKVFFSTQENHITLPSGTQVPMSPDDYRSFNVSTKWDSDLANFLFEKAIHFEQSSTLVILNTSAFGNNAITLAHRLKRYGKKINVVYLDINHASIEKMQQYCGDDYPNLAVQHLDFEYFKARGELDRQCIDLIDRADYFVVQGPWSNFEVKKSSERLEQGYHRCALASFFATVPYNQLKIAFMNACLSHGKTVIETTHKLIANRTLSEENLNHCRTSAFIPIAQSKYMQDNTSSNENGILIRSPR